jgi:hypothetical protein
MVDVRSATSARHNGRPRVKGERLPQLGQVRGEQQTIWRWVQWYHGRRCSLGVTDEAPAWSLIGQPVPLVRSVPMCDPADQLDPRGF